MLSVRIPARPRRTQHGRERQAGRTGRVEAGDTVRLLRDSAQPKRETGTTHHTMTESVT